MGLACRFALSMINRSAELEIAESCCPSMRLVSGHVGIVTAKCEIYARNR